MTQQTAPKVSIGLPVYNGENFLEEAIQSVLAQTFTDFELILCDNASTDGTAEICRRYAALDSRVRYVRNAENVGASRNFNRAFELARGTYFKWAAHDDLLAPEMIEQCVEVLDSEPEVVLCFPQTQIIDNEGRDRRRIVVSPLMVAERPSDRILGHMYVGNHECYAVFGLMRTQVLAKTPLIELYNESDQILLARLALLGQFRELPETLFFARNHPERSIHIDLEDRAHWFDPDLDGKPCYPKWRLLAELIKVVAASNISAQEKGRAVVAVLRWASDRYLTLRRELKQALFALAYRLRLLQPPGSTSQTARPPGQAEASNNRSAQEPVVR